MKEPLSALDKNFLHLHSPSTQQVIASFCVLDRAPDFSAVYSRLEAVSSQFPRLRMRLCGETWCEDKNFQLSNHVYKKDVPADDSQSLLNAAMAEFSRPMDLSRPAWRLVVFRGQKKSAFIFMIHHALSDGLGAFEVLNAFTDSHEGGNKPVHRYPFVPALTKRGILHCIIALVKEVLSSRPASPLAGTNSCERKAFFILPRLDKTRELKTQHQTSVPVILLALVSSALARYYRAHSHPLAEPRAIVPFNTRELSNRHTLGNRVTGIGIRLPIGNSTLHEKIEILHEELLECKTKQTYGTYALAGRLNSYFPHSIARRLACTQARSTDLICTNVPGPQKVQFFGGARIVSNVGLPALMEGHGIAVSFLSYAGIVHVSVVYDPAIIKDPQVLENAFCEEFDPLLCSKEGMNLLQRA